METEKRYVKVTESILDTILNFGGLSIVLLILMGLSILSISLAVVICVAGYQLSKFTTYFYDNRIVDKSRFRKATTIFYNDIVQVAYPTYFFRRGRYIVITYIKDGKERTHTINRDSEEGNALDLLRQKGFRIEY